MCERKVRVSVSKREREKDKRERDGDREREIVRQKREILARIQATLSIKYVFFQR